MRLLTCLVVALTTLSSVLAGEPVSNDGVNFKQKIADFLRDDKLTQELAEDKKKTTVPAVEDDDIATLAKMWSQVQEAKKRLQAVEHTKPSQVEIIDELTVPGPMEICVDARSDCPQLKKLRNNNFCQEMKPEMSVVCNMTCGYCQGTSKVEEHGEAVCKNSLSEKECEILNTTFAACIKRPQKIKTACAKYCGFCKSSVAPPVETSCVSSPFGCCWDGKTAGSGPGGVGCPVCEDDQHSTFCGEMKDSCSSPSIKGELLVKYCPKTCGVCDGTLCRDDSAAAPDCEKYKSDGLCQSKLDIMFIKCRKTCGLCLPPCKDHERCKVISQFITCNDSKLGAELQHICPVTCGVCGEKKPVDSLLDALSSLK